ncbi:MAG TPA: undecaprenyl-diphosphate phosphatase [Thermoleophilia bacterium]|nr:undecaprenyl-diphosphate phosphatase [Thermoleophilia bacterium]
MAGKPCDVFLGSLLQRERVRRASHPCTVHPVSTALTRCALAGAVLLLAFSATVVAVQDTPARAGPAAVAAVNESGDEAIQTQALSTLDAVILGVVEGVTEYLPVSSTGHLLFTEHLLGISDDPQLKTAADSYAIAIQFGAIMAVVILYWGRLMSILRGILGRDRDGRRLAIVLVSSFVPAAVIGLLGEKFIKGYLFALWPITAAWLIGGVVILLVARHDRQGGLRPNEGAGMEDLTIGKAVIVGLLQCIAMWPGVSRSLVTILGGRLVGLSTIAAVEYSFLLGLVTLTAATMFEAVSEGGTIIATFGIVTPLIGMIVAFISAALAVKWMVGYLSRHTLAVFGWYRLGLAVVAGGLILSATV